MINSAKFCVVDTETTGTVPIVDRVIEIGAVIVEGGKITDSFSQLLDPEMLIPQDIVQFTGITTEMVKGQPTFRQVAKEFLDFVGDSIFVAHNVGFDYSFLNEELRRVGEAMMENPTLCTVKLTRKIFPELDSYKLGNVAKALGISLERAHRAVDDSTATAHLLARNINRMMGEGITTLKEMPHLNGYVAPEQPQAQISMW